MAELSVLNQKISYMKIENNLFVSLNNLINLSNIEFNFLDGSYNKLELTNKYIFLLFYLSL